MVFVVPPVLGFDTRGCPMKSRVSLPIFLCRFVKETNIETNNNNALAVDALGDPSSCVVDAVGPT